MTHAWSASWRAPGVTAAPVPDPRTGDRVKCAVEVSAGATFDPVEFGTFVAEQPAMGGKWWTWFVRVVQRVPLTGSNKVNKAPLRAQGWNTTDPVFERVARTSEYVVLARARRFEIEQEFREYGRLALMPTPV